MLLLAAAGALLGLAGAPDLASAKGGGSGSGGGGGDGGDGGGDSSGKGGGDDGGGDDGGDDGDDGDGDGDDSGSYDGGGGKHSGRGKHNDQKRAKDAVRNGSARPLPEILGVVARQYPGKVIDVSLKRRSKILMYDVKLITPEGKLIRVRVDAESAVILGIKGI